MSLCHYQLVIDTMISAECQLYYHLKWWRHLLGENGTTLNRTVCSSHFAVQTQIVFEV